MVSQPTTSLWWFMLQCCWKLGYSQTKMLARIHWCQFWVSCMAGLFSGTGATARWPAEHMLMRAVRSEYTSCNVACLLLAICKCAERAYLTPYNSSAYLCPVFLPVGPFYRPSERLIVKTRGALKCKPHEKTKGLGKSDSSNNNKHTAANLLREINEQGKRTPQHPHLSLLRMSGGRDNDPATAGRS